MLQSTFFRRLFIPYLVLICVTAGGVGIYSGLTLRSSYVENLKHSLRDDLRLIAHLLRDDLAPGQETQLNRVVSSLGAEIGYRITVVNARGEVLADNWADPKDMANHIGRPELVDAAARGEGWSIRDSDTIRADMLYMAIRLGEPSSEHYLRIAVRLRDLSQELRLLYGGVAAVALGAIITAGAIGYHWTRRQAAPILELTDVASSVSRGELNRRPTLSGTGEIAELGAALNAIADQTGGLMHRAASDKAQLLTILSSMAEAVIATDMQQSILVVNSAAAQFFGFDPGYVQGKPLWQVVRIDRVIKTAAEVLRDGERRVFELGMLSGRYLEVCLCRFPGQGKPDGLVLVAHDTTQSVRYQELRKEFVANVSHELRTPLTVIKGFVETLRDGALQDPQKGPEYLSTIERHTNQLTNLVNDLLELSRLESQPDLPQRISVDLAVVARKAIDLLQPAAGRKNQTIVAELHPVPLLAGNADYLERAIANLIDNAVKYTPEGGRITVSTRFNDSEAMLEVADNGIGIPTDDLPRIFERFYRVDRSRSREMGGTGLGLSIVKHIVQAHGGTVDVMSTVGEGSVFRFTIPLPKAEAAA